jgi:TRAP-type transport system periplasmic protein
MSLGDVVPAIQQGAIDGAVSGMGPFAHMHFVDAAKYITLTDQPGIFIIVEVNEKWYESLPKDLQKIVDKDAATQSVAINPFAVKSLNDDFTAWTAGGGELINLPPAEKAELTKTLASVAPDVSKKDPELAAAYKVVADVAARTRQSPIQ